MTDKEKKQFILKNWSRSSGETITEMLKRFYASKSNSDSTLIHIDSNCKTVDKQEEIKFGENLIDDDEEEL